MAPRWRAILAGSAVAIGVLVKGVFACEAVAERHSTQSASILRQGTAAQRAAWKAEAAVRAVLLRDDPSGATPRTMVAERPPQLTRVDAITAAWGQWHAEAAAPVLANGTHTRRAAHILMLLALATFGVAATRLTRAMESEARIAIAHPRRVEQEAVELETQASVAERTIWHRVPRPRTPFSTHQRPTREDQRRASGSAPRTPHRGHHSRPRPGHRTDAQARARDRPARASTVVIEVTNTGTGLSDEWEASPFTFLRKPFAVSLMVAAVREALDAP